MAKRANPRSCQLVRGFILGQLYEKGHRITAARIRGLGVSRATAKRDLKAIRQLVPVRASKPVAGMKRHLPQETLPLKRAA